MGSSGVVGCYLAVFVGEGGGFEGVHGGWWFVNGVLLGSWVSSGLWEIFQVGRQL